MHFGSMTLMLTRGHDWQISQTLPDRIQYRLFMMGKDMLERLMDVGFLMDIFGVMMEY